MSTDTPSDPDRPEQPGPDADPARRPGAQPARGAQGTAAPGTEGPGTEGPGRREMAGARSVTDPAPRPTRRLTARRAQERKVTQPHFGQPVRQIVMMLIVLVLVGFGGWFAYGRILPIFAANPWLNGLILGVFVIGVLACFWQVAQLFQSVSWIERFAERRRNAIEKGVAAVGAGDDRPPRLLAPLAALLGARGPIGGVISTGSARSILESVATRIEEARDITRYLSNLLIFLGLLGTFYGLATTVPAVVETIRALAPQEGQSGLELFDNLMTGLEAQLGGMAVAFSSSLLGLAGSLVVGLLELFATHGQNRFYRELEEWLSGFTRLGLSSDDGDKLDQASILGFLDQIAAQMAEMQAFYTERDEIREQEAIEADERVLLMARNVERLGQFMLDDSEANVSSMVDMARSMSRLTEGQDRLIDAVERQPRDTDALAGAVARLGEGQERLHAVLERRPDEAGEIARAIARLEESQQRHYDRQAEAGPGGTDAALSRVMAQLVEGQDRLIRMVEQNPADMDEMARALTRLADAQDRMIAASGGHGADPQTLRHLRSIDEAMTRMLDHDQTSSQLESYELRREIVELTEALRALGRS
ncbi:hypothetical protein SAMN05421538_10592 [Paracoccus isoporae]|uniref:MotA/TolQ/ExbB proton channel family protein n=1 Tax=Paracoccus isoporae TaxID=591205 RepID=A0A1G7BGV2_9RHOB|nr:hypothetical protein SAMN05421538_10592 [Paracoccus isoporae]